MTGDDGGVEGGACVGSLETRGGGHLAWGIWRRVVYDAREEQALMEAKSIQVRVTQTGNFLTTMIRRGNVNVNR